MTDNCTKVFDAVKDVYKGLNGFQYEDNEFGFVDLDSPIQLADRKSKILLAKTDSPENEEVNGTELATSKVADKKKIVSFGTLISLDSENSESISQHDLHCNYLFICFAYFNLYYYKYFNFL